MIYILQVDAPGGIARLEFSKGIVQKLTLPDKGDPATYKVLPKLIEVRDVRFYTIQGLVEGEENTLSVTISTANATVGFYPGNFDRAVVNPGETHQFVWTWQMIQDTSRLAQSAGNDNLKLVGWREP